MPVKFCDPAIGVARVIRPIDHAAMTDVRIAVTAEGVLTDASANGFDLAASSGPVWITCEEKRGVWIRNGASVYQASGYGDYAPLKLLGAMTEHLLICPSSAALGARAQLGGFFGSGETEAANALWGIDLETNGQIALFWEYGTGGDVRPIQQWGIPVGRWILLSMVRTSGTAYKIYLDGALLSDNTVAQAPTGGSSARFTSADFLGLWGGVVATGVAQTADEVLAVARQVGVCA